MKSIKIIVFIFCVLVKFTGSNAQIQFAELGDFKLDNGSIIKNCKVGYRTFGTLNESRSNVVVFPTWYGGTGESLIPYLGIEGMLDTTQYYVIIMEAFGNGISSSPSNSMDQPGLEFPEFTIRDLVNAQYQVLTSHLHFSSVHAITGISMGGMQTFQWMASYPEYFKVAIPIVGSPALSSYDLMAFSLFIKIMSQCKDDCQQIGESALLLEYLIGFTPEFHHEETVPHEVDELLATIDEESKKYHVLDLLSQMKAMKAHDITSGTQMSYIQVLQQFIGRVLIVYASTDHLVLPHSSELAAKAFECASLRIDSPNGHYAFWNDRTVFTGKVKAILQQEFLSEGNWKR